jgi:hypothetical protein
MLFPSIERVNGYHVEEEKTKCDLIFSGEINRK